jgi:hypothetical protein
VLSPKTDEDDEALEIMLNKWEDRLTDWEVQFLESLADRTAWTERQRELFDGIWEILLPLCRREEDAAWGRAARRQGG